MILDRMHTGLAHFFERNKLPAPELRVDGAVVFNSDGKHRIFCRPAPYGDLILEYVVADVPEQLALAEEMMRVTLLASYLRLSTHADFPVLSRDGLNILIHQRIPADASVDEFEASLENFLNSLSEWRRIFRVL